MRRIELSKEARKDIGKLPPKHARQISTKLFELAANPAPADSVVLKGHDTYRRATQGEYRIIYEFDDDLLSVLIVGKRNDDEVYRRLERKMK